jgi:hypothetical protein
MRSLWLGGCVVCVLWLSAAPCAGQEAWLSITGGELRVLSRDPALRLNVYDLEDGAERHALALGQGQRSSVLGVSEGVEVTASGPLQLLAGQVTGLEGGWSQFVLANSGQWVGTSFTTWAQGELLLLIPRDPTRSAAVTVAVQNLSAPDRSARLTERDALLVTPRHVVFHLTGFQSEILQVSLSHPGVLQLLSGLEARQPWSVQPPSIAPGERGAGLMSRGLFAVEDSVTVLALRDQTRIEITDLTDGDDSGAWTLGEGELLHLGPEAPEGLRRAGVTLGPGLERDLIDLRASWPALVITGALSEGARGGVAHSAPTSPGEFSALLAAPTGAIAVVSQAPATLTLDSLLPDAARALQVEPGAWQGQGPWFVVSPPQPAGLWRLRADAPFTAFALPLDGARCCGPWLPAPTPSPGASAPQAEAGPRLRVCPRQDAALDGSASFDPDGGALVSWRWDLNLDRNSDGLGGASDDLDAQGERVTARYLTSGAYRARLTVADGEGADDVDDVEILVLSPASPDCGGDADNDGLGADQDNCPLVPNANQADRDGDGEGDACDRDRDNDGVLDDDDRCPLDPDPAQADGDGDGLGDACDPDRDGDGVDNARDNCPLDFNRQQRDTDGDGLGDACDPDDDADGVPDDDDSCPLDANSPQIDTDGDGLGDICDPDDDDDGAPDDGDNCPATPNADQADTDRDGVGDACALDRDRDGVPDASDRCPDAPNPDQRDTDGDGEGDACDDDRDGDLLPNGEDNCPLLYNPRQEDEDGNGQGDACEGDADGDGVPDHRDACPSTPDPAQRDLDRDGLGDACDDDRDGDGLDAAQERAWNTRQDNPDTDGDGLNDGDEVSLGTHPARWDTDGDGLSDGQELRFNLAPLRLDTDGDGLRDGAEPGWDEDSDLDGLINALDLDSDNGGLDDGAELTSGRDMLDPTDDLRPAAPPRLATGCQTTPRPSLTRWGAALILLGFALTRASLHRARSRRRLEGPLLGHHI